jgi:4-amino-4-deoxy-L-arabinose transferase-like glycosyltransferase
MTAARKFIRADNPWLMFAIALAIRLIVVGFLYPEQMQARRGFWPFGYEIGRVARSLAEGRGYSSPLFSETGPTAWAAPIYPAILAAVFKVFGVFTATSAIVMLSINSLFSALTVFPLCAAARRSFGERVAKWAGWAWVFYPYAIYFTAARIWDITLSTLLMTTLFAMSLDISTGWRKWKWQVYGVLCGAAALTSPVLLGVVPFLGGWIFLGLRRERRPWVASAIFMALVFLTLVAPWTMRNHSVFGKFIPFRSNFGLELFVLNHGDTSDVTPDSTHPSTSWIELNEYNSLGEVPYMERKKQQALDWIKENPGEFAWVTVRRVFYQWTGFWSASEEFRRKEPLQFPNVFMATSLTVLMILGIRKAWRERNHAAIPYVLMIASFPLVYYVTHPSMDYRQPIDPQIIILAVYGLPRLTFYSARVVSESQKAN